LKPHSTALARIPVLNTLSRSRLFGGSGGNFLWTLISNPGCQLTPEIAIRADAIAEVHDPPGFAAGCFRKISAGNVGAIFLTGDTSRFSFLARMDVSHSIPDAALS
jgi:hypothetical protein